MAATQPLSSEGRTELSARKINRRIFGQVYETGLGWGLYTMRSCTNYYMDLTITVKRVEFKRELTAGRTVEMDMLRVQRMTGLLLNCNRVEKYAKGTENVGSAAEL
jgi:hypothetical protein